MRLSEWTEAQIEIELESFEAMNQIVQKLSVPQIKIAMDWMDKHADPTQVSTGMAKRVCEAAIQSKQDHRALLDYYRTYLTLKQKDPREGGSR